MAVVTTTRILSPQLVMAVVTTTRILSPQLVMAAVTARRILLPQLVMAVVTTRRILLHQLVLVVVTIRSPPKKQLTPEKFRLAMKRTSLVVNNIMVNNTCPPNHQSRKVEGSIPTHISLNLSHVLIRRNKNNMHLKGNMRNIQILA